MRSVTADPLVYTVAEAQTLLKLGRTAAYEAIKRGEIPHVVIGHKILVPKVALDKMLAQAGADEVIDRPP